DGRVLKAVLLNSADKTAGWNNGQVQMGPTVVTAQALDYAVGTGRMNLNRAFDQYFAGTHDVPGLGGGTVSNIGWHFGELANRGTFKDYLIGAMVRGGSTFTATLSWFIDRFLRVGRDTNGDYFTSAILDGRFANLDLSLWLAPGGVPILPVA